MAPRNHKTQMSEFWRTAGPRTPCHIRVASFRDGWTVGVAAMDNAQFFHKRADAEAAARSLGERLSRAGDPCKISVRLANGESGGDFVVSKSTGWEAGQP